MKRRLFAILIAVLFILLMFSVSAASSKAQQAAAKLHTLGFLNGTGYGFELDRSITYEEATALIIRILGRESEAMNSTYSHPFTDVSPWASAYVGYAYREAILLHPQSNQLGATKPVTSAQYLTLLLRALGDAPITGYDVNNAYEASDLLGLTHGEYTAKSKFTRGDAAILAFTALGITYSRRGQPLINIVYQAGAVTPASVKATGLDSLIEKGLVRIPLDQVTNGHTPLDFYAFTRNVFAMEYLDKPADGAVSQRGVVLFGPTGKVFKTVLLPEGYSAESRLVDDKIVYTPWDTASGQMRFIDAMGNMGIVTKENGADIGLQSPDGTKTAFTFSGDLYLTDSGITRQLQIAEYFPDRQVSPFCWIDNSRLVYYQGSKTFCAYSRILNVDESVTPAESPRISMKPVAFGDGKLYLLQDDDVYILDVNSPYVPPASYIPQENRTRTWSGGTCCVSPDSEQLLFSGTGMGIDGAANKFRVYSIGTGELFYEKELPACFDCRPLFVDRETAIVCNRTLNELIVISLE